MTRAILLDLDGTIIDSDPLHAAVFVELLAKYGRQVDEAFYFTDVHGRQNVDIFTELLPGEDPQAMSEMKEAMYRARLGAIDARPIAGLPGLLDRAAAAGIPVGLVTNAPRLNADAVLSALGLSDRFATLVIGDECARGKPDPLPYTTGLANLGVAPDQAFAVEDSPSGIVAARAAGIYTLGIMSSLTSDALIGAGADETISDFNDTAVQIQLDRLTGADQ